MAFYSKKLTPAESYSHVTDRELRAMHLACMKWRHYLYGNVCHVYTDHEPPTYIFVSPHLNTRQAHWLEHLAELDLKVHYVLWKENVAVDVLSRYGQHVDGADGLRTGSYSLADAMVSCAVHEWLGVVAKHVSLDECVGAASEALSCGH